MPKTRQNGGHIHLLYEIMASLHPRILARIKDAKKLCFYVSNMGFSYAQNPDTTKPIITPRSREANVLKHKYVRIMEDVKSTLLEASNEPAVSWPKITDKILEISLEVGEEQLNKTSVILNSCNCPELVPIGVSYYRYLLETKGKLSLTEYSLFIVMLASCPQEKLVAFKDVVIDIFNNVKPFIENLAVIKSEYSKVFASTRETWQELYDIRYQIDRLVWNWLAAGAFDCDEASKGWSLLNENVEACKIEFVSSYFNYCIRKAKNNNFSLSLLHDIVRYCEDFTLCIPHTEILRSMEVLVDELNKNRNRSYDWVVENCAITNSSCSACQTELQKTFVTREEFMLLKSHLLKDGMISSNINIKTSQRELRKFMSFLSRAESYNFVIDGLNLIYLSKQKKIVYNFIRNLKNQGKKILVVAKKHINKHHAFNYLSQNCQIFLTDNQSDDDLFILYAALHGGIGTNFISRDFYRSYYSLIDDVVTKRIFLKWQLTHQSVIRTDFTLASPPGHSNTPQLKMKSDNYYWHFCCHSSQRPVISSLQECNWICLRAKKRKS